MFSTLFKSAVASLPLLLLGCATAPGSAASVPAPSAVPGAPGSQFKDCPQCPDMVVVPAGSFVMGSPAAEKFRGGEAQHPVTIAKPFAVGKFEVTFDQWGACVAAGGCDAYAPPDEGWGRGKRPAIHVNWLNAKAYVAWLSKQTGKPYRLLSEAEWEYAARGGKATAYFTGDRISAQQANFDASSATDANPVGVMRAKTLPVGSFAPNGFGLHDMHGNVWEWTEDCWHDEYTGAPADGRSWQTPGCDGHVMRGGSWEDYAGDIRAAARVGSFIDEESYADGLRVARDLS